MRTRASSDGSLSCGLVEGHRLAARVSGDSAVAYSWAYCQALEGLAGCAIPPRAAWLRGLALEVERIANHLGDLGALGNDAGFAFGLAQFSRLKEHWLRAIERGLRPTLPDGLRSCPAALRSMSRRMRCGRLPHARADWRSEVRALRQIYEEHDGVRDRFATTGMRLTGARRPARAHRTRGARERPGVRRPGRLADPAIRRARRRRSRSAREAMLRRGSRCASTSSWNPAGWSRASQAGCPDGSSRAEVAVAHRAGSFGLGVVEGWRGPVLVALMRGPAIGCCAAIRTTHRGRTGLCSSTRSSATSFRTFR